jgi:starch synthase
MIQKENKSKFIVATPIRSVCDNNARVLQKKGLLRFLALGTRHGTDGVPLDQTRLNPWIGLSAYVAARTLSPFSSESFRFRLLPWFDHWVLKQLTPGDHIISSYGYVNECFKFTRKNKGKTFLDAGNSHIENYWEIISEEHRRWNCQYPPFSHFWYDRSRAMLPEVDYVLSPSSYVTKSFLARDFKAEQILPNIYPVDLSLFQPSSTPRPKNRPLTIINTGSISLRKGAPYLLEAFRIILRRHPSAKLKLTRILQDDVKPILSRYRDLPIDWSPGLPHAELAERLRNSDIFVLPSLEDGFARTVTEALACGLPVITTANTGASDLIEPGRNGEIVAIRDSHAIAEAILKWADRLMSNSEPSMRKLDPADVSFEAFGNTFLEQLKKLGLML